MSGSIDAFVGNLVQKIREQRDHAARKMVQGGCASLEHYRVEVARVGILNALEQEILGLYRKQLDGDPDDLE